MGGKKHQFLNLTPTHKAELGAYQDALNYVFEHDEIRNVAISGAYSSGKSSVIETYKAIHKEKKFIHISLAHFVQNETAEKSHLEDAPEMTEKVLEGKILNQLIHQVPPREIPQTNFRVKKANMKRDRGIAVSLGLLLIVMGLYLWHLAGWRDYVASVDVEWLKPLVTWSIGTAVPAVAGLLSFIILAVFAYKLINAQLNKGILKKVSVQGADIEILGDNEDSYFDRYLNEVIYLFENSGAEVIVFEDIDRYNANRIFERLREVNTLVNAWRKRECEQYGKLYFPVRFFYLLRDDIFTNKDRTKFFDFIIPVIPVIDGSNSYEKLIEIFSAECILALFSDSFLKEASLYIDDMRILKNILNEFIVYHDKIQTTELNNDKLLAMVIYKNIFPRDFSELQLFRGYVFELFEKKEVWIAKKVAGWTEDITQIEEKLAQSYKENLTSTDELDALYLFPNITISTVAGKSMGNIDNRAEITHQIRQNPNQVAHMQGNYAHPLNVNSAIAKMERNQEYIQRREVIQRKGEETETLLKERISELRRKCARLEGASMKFALQDMDSRAFFSEEMAGKQYAYVINSPYHDLIVYLVRNGYLDEDYSDYMTFFYPNSISRKDRIFLRSVTDRRAKGYDYELDSPERVYSRLKTEDFQRGETLNFALLECMLQCNSIGLNHIFLQIKNCGGYEFIFGFIDRDKQIPAFIAGLNRVWTTIIECILNEKGLSADQKRNYVVLSLNYTGRIHELNGHNSLRNYVSSCPDFLNLQGPMADNVIDPLTAIGVRFKQLDYEKSNKALFRRVYERSLYEITWSSIVQMLDKIYGLEKEEDIQEKSLSLILSQPEEPLAKYVEGNIETYMKVMLPNCRGRIIDDEAVVLQVLNSPDLSYEMKAEYIDVLSTVIDNLDAIDDKELWAHALDCGIVAKTETNVVQYYLSRDNEMDQHLVGFINSSGTIRFTKAGINTIANNDIAGSFFTSVVLSMEMDDDKYRGILSDLKLGYSDFTYQDVADPKMQILLSQKTIRMTEPNVLLMREHYPKFLSTFICGNIDEYASKVINEGNFDFDELVMLLSTEIDDRYKLRLMQLTDRSITIGDKSFSENIVLEILQSHLDENELHALFNKYVRMTPGIKRELLQLANERAVQIVHGEFEIGNELFCDMVIAKQVDQEQLLEILAFQLPKMSEVTAISVFQTLGLSDFIGLFNRKRPRFEMTTVNEKVLGALKERFGIKYDDKTDSDGVGYYQGNGRSLWGGLKK